MRLKYLQYEQPGGVFYACTMSAADIVNRLEIRRRSDGDDGIQRDENAKRVRDIASYARQVSSVFPTPVIIAAYSNKVSVSDGFLELSDEGILGHILDGQHRILGLRLLDSDRLKQMNLLLVFVFEVEAFAQATIFTTINSNQKQVSKSLIYDLFGLDPSRTPQRTSHEIARSLNDDPSSPFFRRIKLLGAKVEETETLSQAAFVDRLLDVMRERDSLLMKFYSREEDSAIRRVLANAFSGLVSAIQVTPNNYPENFFLKTTGYGGVMKSLNAIIGSVIAGGSLREDVFFNVFCRFLQENPVPAPGTGNSAMLAIKVQIESVLN